MIRNTYHLFGHPPSRYLAASCFTSEGLPITRVRSTRGLILLH